MAAYANELTGLCRPEELLQLFRYSTRLGKQCGVRVNSAMMSDVPGFTWGTVTALSQAGIRYFSAAPNYLRPHRHFHGHLAGQAILVDWAIRQGQGAVLGAMDGLRHVARHEGGT